MSNVCTESFSRALLASCSTKHDCYQCSRLHPNISDDKESTGSLYANARYNKSHSLRRNCTSGKDTLDDMGWRMLQIIRKLRGRSQISAYQCHYAEPLSLSATHDIPCHRAFAHHCNFQNCIFCYFLMDARSRLSQKRPQVAFSIFILDVEITSDFLVTTVEHVGWDSDAMPKHFHLPLLQQLMCYLKMRTCKRLTARRRSPEVRLMRRSRALPSTDKLSALHIICNLSNCASRDTCVGNITKKIQVNCRETTETTGKRNEGDISEPRLKHSTLGRHTGSNR